MENDAETGAAEECRCCKEMAERARKCIREHPVEAALASAATGFLLAQFPVRRLLGGVFCLLKPAAVLYGIFRVAEDCHAGRWGADKSPE